MGWPIVLEAGTWLPMKGIEGLTAFSCVGEVSLSKLVSEIPLLRNDVVSLRCDALEE
jgi:hypothetical protein